jgi:hypothetical protein
MKSIKDSVIKKDANESYTIEGKNIYVCYPQKNYAVINDIKGTPKVDYNLELIDHLKKHRVRHTDGRHRILIGDKSELLYREIYRFIKKEDLTGFEIDHLNSKPNDNRMWNLQKLLKQVHSAKLNAIDKFYMPYTINIGVNHTNGRYMLVLADWGMYITNGELVSSYKDNFIAYFEYLNAEDIIHDLNLFSKHPKVLNEGNEGFAKVEIGTKIRLLAINKNQSKASRVRMLKLDEKKYEGIWQIYLAHNILTGGNSQGSIEENDFILDFDIFDRTEEELKERGFVKSDFKV